MTGPIIPRLLLGPAAARTAEKRDQADDPAAIRDAAQQFESLLIAQLLKTSRGSDSGNWLGTGDDEAGSQAIELAQEQFAQSLAAQGGLGLARLVLQGLSRPAASPRTDALGRSDQPIVDPQ